MEVKIFKLVDGSLVIGLEGETEILDVVEVYVHPTERGLSINLSPFMYPFNQSMTGKNLPLTKTISSCVADDQLRAEYTKATTGIVVAQSMPSGSNLKLVTP